MAIEKKEKEMVFMGTMVVRRSLDRVKSIGAATEMGKIGKSLETIENEDTNLQRQTKQKRGGSWFLVNNTLFVIGFYFGLIKRVGGRDFGQFDGWHGTITKSFPL